MTLHVAFSWFVPRARAHRDVRKHASPSVMRHGSGARLTARTPAASKVAIASGVACSNAARATRRWPRG
jgi:hypothetical protein